MLSNILEMKTARKLEAFGCLQAENTWGIQRFLENYHVLFAPLGTHRLLVILKNNFVALQVHHSVACTYTVVMKVLEYLRGSARRLTCQPRVARLLLQLSQLEIRDFSLIGTLKTQIACDRHWARAIVILKN